MQDMLRSVFVCEKVSSDFGKCLRSHNCLWRSKAPQQRSSAICIGQVDDGLSTLVTSAKAGASCSEYMQKLREHGMLPSMSRPSNPYDWSEPLGRRQFDDAHRADDYFRIVRYSEQNFGRRVAAHPGPNCSTYEDERAFFETRAINSSNLERKL